MFTGIIEEVGTVKNIARNRNRVRLEIEARKVLEDLQVDHSICIDGVCLTVIERNSRHFQVEAVKETLQKTTLSKIRIGDKVNLERPLRPWDRLGGHLVQGHVDGIGRIIRMEKQNGSVVLSLELPPELTRYAIYKGSIAIDGISLTLADIQGHEVTISIIPHTLEHTTLGIKKPGERVNVEMDVIGKYVESVLSNSTRKIEITEDWLHQVGY